MIIIGMIRHVICWYYGHRRGIRIKGTDTLACPRCGASWQRKLKNISKETT